MKKLLELLGTVTIVGSSMLTVATTSLVSIQEKEIKLLDNEINYLKINNLEGLKRNKRRTPPSLKNIITTINIGEIKKVNKNSVIKRLSEINHPILSRQDFLENIVFENITNNFAIVRINQNIRFGSQINNILPDTMLFTISFNSNIVDFNSILGISNQNAILDLRSIYNNGSNIIAREFIKRNNLSDLLTVDDLIITNLTENSAVIKSSYINYKLFVKVIFLAWNISLETFITNTDLGNLEINSEEHIINRIRELNNIIYPHTRTNIRLIVENITRNSAEISFNGGSPNSFISDSEQSFDSDDKIIVTFSTKKNTLSSVITNTDLGELSNNSFSTIKESIVKANQNSELIINDIEFEYITYGWAKIRSNNPNFTGSVDITFNPRHLDLSSVITNSDLGLINDNSTRSIINAILETNNNFFEY